MNTWHYTRLASRCELLLRMRVRQIFDLQEAKYILRDMGRSGFSPILDPEQNDLSPANCFWLIAEDSSGPVIAGGVRFDDITGLDILTHWERLFSRIFSQRPVMKNADNFPTQLFAGSLAYFGDLGVSGRASLSKQGKAQLRMFNAIGHFLSQVHFNPDVTYCFLQERDVLRGAPVNYGFPEVIPICYQWETQPFKTGTPEYVAVLRRSHFPEMMAGIERLIAASSRKILEAKGSQPRPEQA